MKEERIITEEELIEEERYFREVGAQWKSDTWSGT